jgi:hypothetical protein
MYQCVHLWNLFMAPWCHPVFCHFGFSFHVFLYPVLFTLLVSKLGVVIALIFCIPSHADAYAMQLKDGFCVLEEHVPFSRLHGLKSWKTVIFSFLFTDSHPLMQQVVWEHCECNLYLSYSSLLWKESVCPKSNELGLFHLMENEPNQKLASILCNTIR